ncbi:MAG: ABC transporter substrate-binding protein [Candidatus Taylorbacteria bacterium]|nr:ABC transporter substrate-binding protein [Candidatus Taylorbacteria bacterium]
MKEKIIQLLSKRFTIPKSELIEQAIGNFSLTEKVLFYLGVTALILSSLFALSAVSNSFMVEVPTRGGSITEGVIGLPHFVNPVLALSDTDRDLTTLVYSGLLKATPEGTLIPDLAQSYTISPDGLTYTFTLKPNLTFHDGTPLTADDVIFTIEKCQDSGIKSPKRPNWEGVSTKKISDLSVELTLKQPYSPFLENTTIGVLPKHIWSNVGSDEFSFGQFNIEPVGSGPYKMKSIERNASGIPVAYRLQAFDEYALGAPLIKTFVFRFFQNNDALINAYQNGTVESIAGISPTQAQTISGEGGRIERTPLPRIFAVFFNESHAPVLAYKEVRRALEIATDKQSIVDTVLNGEGIAIDSPIPPSLLQRDDAASDTTPSQDKPTEEERIASAKKILEASGWKWNEEKQVYEKTVKKVVTPLTFSISTSNALELQAVALMLQSMWQKIGAQVEVKISEIGELNQNVIRSRKYDTLLFGEIIGRDLDLFAFWHSSQRNDPGLNIALYTNTVADKLLEDARTITDRDTRLVKYRLLQEEIKNDLPAIFIYSPDFLYLLPARLKGFSFGRVTVPAERFLNVEKWYIDTDRVWKIYAPK